MSTQISLLFLVFALIFLVLEIATVMFKLTGLSRETAQFQAISIISANGFTTVESELIARHPMRRKIAMGLMICGPISLAFIISIIVSMINAELAGTRDILLISGFMLVGFLMLRSLRFITFFENYLERNLAKRPAFCQICSDELLNVGEHAVSEVILTNPQAPLVNHTLKEIKLQECGVIILSIERDGKITHVPRGSDIILPGDKLLIYGRPAQIKRYAGQDL